MDFPFRVLVFPGGTEIGLELWQSLSLCKEAVLFSAGERVSSHASFAFLHNFHTPSVHESRWLESLLQLISLHRITHIFPAHDDVVLALAETASKIPAKVITSPLQTCRIARLKSLTIAALSGLVPMPKIFQCPEAVDQFPVFLKPDRGQGSQGVALARNHKELAAQFEITPDRLIMEYLPGEEYTVDCFSDRELGLLFVGGRQRVRIRSGIAMNCIVRHDERFLQYAQAIASKLTFHGAWFFQVKADAAGTLRLLEVAPRIGGTSAFSRVRGVNLPLLSLFEAERVPVTISPLSCELELDRALVNRFKHDLVFSTVYIDFDDTLVVHGRLNIKLVRFVYQNVQNGIKNILLTRHRGDLSAALARLRLMNTFDAVIQISEGERKSDFIKEKEAIFIDDSFSERIEVGKRLNIPVFDSSMIEVLIDERI